MSVNVRIGQGFDVHAFGAGDHVMLGGVRVPCPWRVIAHSDGDVVLHALCDALLGAVAAGDLGEHFPDNDPSHRGRDSAFFIERVLALPQLAAWRLANVDVNIIAETPRLLAHKPAIRARVQALLALPAEAVGIKARSHEGVDAVGEKRAISAQAVVLLERR